MKLTREKIRDAASQLKDPSAVFLDRRAEQEYRWLSFLWIGLLYAAGIYFWGSFFHWTRLPLDFEDWGVINSPRLDFLSDAFRSGSPPLHMVYEKFEGQVRPLHFTDRFFAIPDVITTPQTLLLMRLTISQFVFVDLLVNFTLGTLGLLWFRRKYGLSLMSFGILFLLFNFNGYIQSHYAVGHITWAGYFLFPFFIALVIQLIEERPDWNWVARLSLLLFYMLLAGSQHHFTWALIFLGVLALVCMDKLKWIVLGGLFAGLLGAVRLLPPVLILQDVYVGAGNRLLPGYPTVLDVMRSLVTLVPPAEENFIASEVSWLRHWEFDIYVGLVGAVFLLYFGLYRWIREGHQYPALQRLYLPVAVLLLLTLGRIFAFARTFHIPLLDSERVPSRMIGLPLVVIVLVAAVYYQKWLDDSSLPKSVLLMTGFLVFLLTANDLWAHLNLWNLDAVRTALGPVQIMLSGSSVGNRLDRRYIAVLLFGMFLSLSTAMFLFYRIRKAVNGS